jgi:hypothetical protein
MDASPRGEGEKTMNPILKGFNHGSNVSTGQGFSQAGRPGRPGADALLEKDCERISVFGFGPGTSLVKATAPALF